MARTTKGKKAMDSLLGVLAEKEFGQYYELSEIAATSKEAINSIIKEMAEQLAKAVTAEGYHSVDDGARVVLRLSDSTSPLATRNTIGAAMHSAFDADPLRFVIFCAHQMKEADRQKDFAKNGEEYAEKRLNSLIEIIGDSRTIGIARKRLKKMLEPEEYEDY